MVNTITVQSRGLLARVGDVVLSPVMYIISGTFSEAPQLTHRWNSVNLSPDQVAHLRRDMSVRCHGIETAGRRFWLRIPLFHIPCLGGWKDYVVIQPVGIDQSWHVGWIADDVIGISQIDTIGPVRMLLGPGEVTFFGIDTEGNQLHLEEIAQGRIGGGGKYTNAPLL